MANAKASQGSDWFESQKQYWDEWFQSQKNMFTGQMPGAAQMQSQWAEFFRAWQQGISGGDTPPNAAAWQKFFTESGRHFLGMMQKFQETAAQDKPPQDAAREWLDMMRNFMGGAGLQTPANPWAQAFRQNPFQAQQPFANWHNPGLSSFDPFGFAASMPGIGYTREKQDDLNELYKRWAEFERMTAAYNSAMSKIGMDAVARFQEYLASPPEGASPLTSLKDVYVKWVDVCEELYAKYAVTEEYTKIYGDTVNALMAFKKKFNEVTDDTLDQFGLPTRKELDTMHELSHRLRRENIQLKKDIAELQKAVFGKTPARPAPAKRKTPPKGQDA